MAEKKEWSPFQKTLFWIGIFCVFGLIVQGGNRKNSSQSSQNVSLKYASDHAVKTLTMTPAEHLDAAKKALADGYKPNKDIMKASYGRVADARQHLIAVVPSAPEYNESVALLGEVRKRETKIEQASGMMIKALKKEQRKEFSKRFELMLLEKDMDTTITVSGKNNATLRIKWVLMSRPLVHKFINSDETMQPLINLGFEKVIFTDGYDRTWSYAMGK